MGTTWWFVLSPLLCLADDADALNVAMTMTMFLIWSMLRGRKMCEMEYPQGIGDLRCRRMLMLTMNLTNSEAHAWLYVCVRTLCVLVCRTCCSLTNPPSYASHLLSYDDGGDGEF